MTEKFEMVAKTFQGLEGVLADELRALGAEDVTEGRRMVSFTGDKEMMYRANFCCHTALRILKPFFKFHSPNADDLYEQVKGYDWSKVMDTHTTFAIDATTFGEEFSHSRFVTYRVKDAIADYFMDHEGKRPSIRITNPEMRLDVHINGQEVTLSLDSSGEPLYKRGWRVAQTDAPINEVLAAGIIRLSGWDGQTDLIDPMCGSGTFLVEAALIAQNINPGIFRKEYAFQHWKDYDEDLFSAIYNDDSNEREFTHKIYGYDIAHQAIAIAKANAKAAGVNKVIELQQRDIADWTEAPSGSTIITNPPYGERLKVADMETLYTTIGNRLKNVFKGCQAWIIGYSKEHFDWIGLKPSINYLLFNGSLECELREYIIFDGTYNDLRSRGDNIKNKDFRASDRSNIRRNFHEMRDDRPDGERREFRPRRNDRPDGEHREFRPRRDDRPDGEHREFRPRRDNRPDGEHREFRPRRDDRPDGEHREFRPRRDDRPDGEHREFRPRRDDQPNGERREFRPRRDDRPDGEHREFRPSRSHDDFETQDQGPRLGTDKEVPIIHGRRKSWKRRDLDEPNPDSKD